jgi:UPF0716 family protein affecting phage T7 exclusion
MDSGFTSGLMALFMKVGMWMIRNKGTGNTEQLITNCLKGNGKTERDKAKAL